MPMVEADTTTMSQQQLIEGTPEEDLLRIVEREIHKKNKTSEIFREYHPAQIAKFEFAGECVVELDVDAGNNLHTVSE